MILLEAIQHHQTREFRFPLSRQELCIRIRARKGDVRECTLHHWDRCRTADTGELRARLTCFARDRLFDYFETILRTRGPARYVRYYFELAGGGDVVYVTPRGASRNPSDGRFFEFLYANERDVTRPPRWTSGAVFYQIFPDRFANGDPSNDPPNTERWDSSPTRENFFGGDLWGIIGKLEYLAGLGITAIYINPLFLSPSNHKYDTTDYLQIDLCFGTADLLRELVKRCHARNIRVILDGVFNHCGYSFAPFQDVVRNGQRSGYRNWFYIDSFPVRTDPPNYECVGGYKWMPKLRTAEPQVREYLLGVARRWVKEAGIDGWRFDVADEVEYSFWQEMRRALKDLDEEVFLLGETWKEALDMLRGDQMDSVMNYPFADLAAEFFAMKAISPSQFDAELNRLLALYSRETTPVLYNLLDSHDTPRFLRRCADHVERFKLAVGFQMTYPGIPAIYYGDEVGMADETDPDCRRPMLWDPHLQNAGILSWYRLLIALRRSLKSLSVGDFRSVVCDDQRSLYGFVRRHEDEMTYVVLNNAGASCTLEVPVCDAAQGIVYRDLLAGDALDARPLGRGSEGGFHNADIIDYNGTVSVSLGGHSMSIFTREPVSRALTFPVAGGISQARRCIM